MNKLKQIAISFFILSISFTTSGWASNPELEAVRQAIERYHLGWTAGETSVSRLALEERQKLYGAIPETLDPDKVVVLPEAEDIPPKWDWRDNDGNWMTPVTDQQMCGSCVHMATIGAVEAWYKIKSGSHRTKVNLSEQFLLSCGSGSCDNGWYISAAHDFMRNVGSPSEECLPYKAWDGIPCDDACEDWAAEAVRIPDWAAVSEDQGTVWELKNAIYNKPVETTMAVYTSFNFYESGVYQHTQEDSVEGWHAVVLVGWNDDLECWIAKNSWGMDWGEQGYFHIRWGDSYIGSTTAIIWDEPGGSPAMQVNPDELTLSLSPGEKAYRSIEITNAGAGNLEYVTRVRINSMPGEGDDWIAVQYGTGSLSAGETGIIYLQINAAQSARGFYQGVINIEGNETKNHKTKVIPVTVEVVQREHDVAVEKSLQPVKAPITMRVQPKVVIRNWGNQDQSNFAVQCRASKDGNGVFSDISHIESLATQQALVAEFANFSVLDSGVYKIEFSLSGVTNDENPTNNVLYDFIKTSNFVDDFETISEFWDTDNTWGLSDQFGGGFRGHLMMHCNSGRHYENNMNNSLTFTPGFDLSKLTAATLNFWARYAMETDKDYCFVEACVDRQNWIILESMTGSKLRWHQREVSLSDLTGPGNEKVQIRFRFNSNDTKILLGVMLDDIEIFPGVETVVESPEPLSGVPLDFSLRQNYPNPFNPTTTIEYNLPESGHVRLAIYDPLGRHVRTLVDAQQQAGHFETGWDGNDERDVFVAAGVYFCRMEAKDFVKVIKLALVR